MAGENGYKVVEGVSIKQVALTCMFANFVGVMCMDRILSCHCSEEYLQWGPGAGIMEPHPHSHTIIIFCVRYEATKTIEPLHFTQMLLYLSFIRFSPVCGSHMITCVSYDAVANKAPSGENSHETTSALCPSSFRITVYEIVLHRRTCNCNTTEIIHK